MNEETLAPLRAAGIPDAAIAAYAARSPKAPADFAGDAVQNSALWQASLALLGHLPAKPQRSPAQRAAAAAIGEAARAAREAFLTAHVETVYDHLTAGKTRFVRLENLMYEAGALVPGLTPSRAAVAAESALLQGHKEGFEIDQGIFLAHALANRECGRHLLHAMLLPHPRSAEHMEKYARDGRLDLGAATIERKGKASFVSIVNPAALNAEDDGTLDATEICVDLATLDPQSDIAVLRGGLVDHPKYRGRRVFGSGINLTHLYHGKISYSFYMRRDAGFVHKLLRGVAGPAALPDDFTGFGTEKPWIAAVEAFAVGGHCQLLLTMDYVLAADDAFMTLPARKEGIIPGAANLRLPRFVGDRIARQAIQYERKLVCDSPEGRLICDEIAPARDMDAAIARVIDGLTNAGAVSAVSNRRAFRVGQEPLEMFRQYMAVYAREQAYCHFSPALIANLERNWNAQNRKV